MNFHSFIYHLRVLLKGERNIHQLINHWRYSKSSTSFKVQYKPIVLSIPVTDRCNMRCRMCHTHSPIIPDHANRHISVKDMSLNLFKKIVDTFREVIKVEFIGTGEPLLNKEIFHMIEYSKKSKMDTILFSNGFLVGKFHNKIIQSGVDVFNISINGHNEREFNRMTGMDKSIWREIAKNSERVGFEKNRHFKFGLSFIIDKYNVKEIQRMIDFGANLGADSLIFCNFLPSERDGLTANERTIFMHDYNPMTEKENYNVPKGLTVILLQPISDNLKKCHTFFEKIRVDGEGNVGGCSMQLLALHENGKFDDPNVWNNDYFMENRKKFLEKNKKLASSCLVCPSNSPHKEVIICG